MSLTRSLPQSVASRFASSARSGADHRDLIWRALLMAVAALLVIAAAALSKPSSDSWSRVPAGAQGAISGSLGRNDVSYHASATPLGLLANNYRHGLSIGFTAHGV